MNPSDAIIDDPQNVRPGSLIDGKYLVSRVIGQGGMGMVVAAKHVELEELVAIKLLLPGTDANQEVVTRFLREAKAAVRLKSPHAARIHDVGRLPSGLPFIVMEYLEGKDLSDWVSESGALPIDLAVEFLLQTGEAIAEAHSLGIIHRDLKPSNLFCAHGPDGMPMVKVLDFGISKLIGKNVSNNNPARTSTRAILGSPLYMSPEQLRSARDVDTRTDIWSLGIILYELLSGTPPFGGETFPELIFQIMHREPPPLRSLRPEIPPGLVSVVACCLAKDSAKRYESVAALADALLPFAPKRASESVERISRILRNSQSPITPSFGKDSKQFQHSTLAAWGRSWGFVMRGRRQLLSVGLLMVLAIAVGGTLFVQTRRNSLVQDFASADAGLASQVVAASPTISSAATAVATERSLGDPASHPLLVEPATPSATIAPMATRPPELTARKRSRSSPPLAIPPQAATAARVPSPKPDPFADPH